MIHELTLNQQEKEEVKKRKPIALVAKIQEGKEESSEEEKNESEVAFLAKKIRNFMRKKKVAPRKRIIDREKIEKEKKRENLICFECKRLGYVRSEYPKLRKAFKKKKKTFMVTQSDARSLHPRMNIKNAPTQA